MSLGHTIVWIVGIIALLLATLAISTSANIAVHEGTERIKACTLAGGTWIDSTGDCIANRGDIITKGFE